MANAIIMCMLKEYIYIKYMFVAGGGSLEPGIILYTFHFLFSVTCVTVSKFYLLGDPQ